MDKAKANLVYTPIDFHFWFSNDFFFFQQNTFKYNNSKQTRLWAYRNYTEYLRRTQILVDIFIWNVLIPSPKSFLIPFRN